MVGSWQYHAHGSFVHATVYETSHLSYTVYFHNAALLGGIMTHLWSPIAEALWPNVECSGGGNFRPEGCSTR